MITNIEVLDRDQSWEEETTTQWFNVSFVMDGEEVDKVLGVAWSWDVDAYVVNEDEEPVAGTDIAEYVADLPSHVDYNDY